MSQSPLAAPPPWDLVAVEYAAELTPILARYAEDALRLANVVAGARVVDVAAGPGTLSFLAAERGARVSALDFSPRMIAELDARIAREGVTIDARVGDGQSLPYGDGAFDAAFSMFGLMFFPDRARGWRELARVLAPGGVAVVSSWLPMSRVEALTAVFGALRALVPSLPTPPPPVLATVADCEAEMIAGGFASVEVHEITHTSTYPSTRVMWSSMLRSSAPLSLLRERLGADAWAPIEAGVLASLLDSFGEGPREVAMPAFLTVGRRAVDG